MIFIFYNSLYYFVLLKQRLQREVEKQTKDERYKLEVDAKGVVLSKVEGNITYVNNKVKYLATPRSELINTQILRVQKSYFL